MKTNYLFKAKDIIKNALYRNGRGIFKVPLYARDDHRQQFLYYHRMFELVSFIEGDIVECGVGVGRTFTILAGLAQEERRNRTVYGFDSFEGFPEPTIEDASKRNPKKGDWSEATAEVVAKRLIKNKINQEKTILVKGFFKDTLPHFKSKIAFLHLDVDLYDSYKTCLSYLFPLVVEGGVILFDEYLNAKDVFPGAVQAIDEYFGEKKRFIRYDSTVQKYFYLK